MGSMNTRFDGKLYIEFMYIKGADVLHRVDEATQISAARFVSALAVESAVETILLLYKFVDTGLLSISVID